MIKAAVFGVLAAMLAAWIRSVKPEYSVWVLLAAGVMLAVFTTAKLGVIVEELQILRSFFEKYSAYFTILLKIIGITYLAEISADLCRDAGANAMASQVELFGKLSILVLCMPVLTALLESVGYFLGG